LTATGTAPAALEAQRVQRDPQSIAQVFDVAEHNKPETCATIDFLKDLT
jgi:hypothetical protein